MIEATTNAGSGRCRRRNVHVRSPNVCRRSFTGIFFALLLSQCGS
jgi:hypothetical protein